jgi:hypothetical protein
MATRGAGEALAGATPGQQVMTFSRVVFQEGCWVGPAMEANCMVYRVGDSQGYVEVMALPGGGVHRYTYPAGGTVAIRISGNVIHLPAPATSEVR